MGTRMHRTLVMAGHTAGVAVTMILNLLRDVSAALADNDHDERQLQDTDVIGEYNYRTGRLDAGNDPYGWYDED